MSSHLTKRGPQHLTKRGNVWHYDVTVEGVRHRGSTRQTDKKLAAAVCAQLLERANRAAVYGPASELTFAEAARLYLQRNGNDWKLVEKLVKEWGARKAHTINSVETQALARRLHPHGMPATRNRNVISPVSVIINNSADHGLCHHMRFKRFPAEKPLRNPGSKPWLAAFQAAARARGKPHIAAIARFMFETGARIGQTVDLEWADLNLPEGKAVLRTRKTGADGAEFSHREAALTPSMTAEIANLERIHPHKVFGYSGRDTPVKMWDKIVREAKLPKLSRHEAGRHGFFTETIVRNGIDPVTACAAGGMKTVKLALETYSHAERAAKMVNDVFGRG